MEEVRMLLEMVWVGLVSFDHTACITNRHQMRADMIAIL